MDSKKMIIGILGGIGSGKSSAAAEFARLGCGVIDADRMVGELLEDETIILEIRQLFGDDILGSNGKIDKSRLSEKVFENAENVAGINNIIHGPVLARSEELIGKLNRSENVKAIVLDMPLLAEVGWHKRCDKLVFVDCKPGIRAQRIEKKGGFSKKQLKKRENFQISLDSKAKIADYIIDNNSDLSALADQVFRIFSIELDK
jgi:dephospho-CoA kinase